MIEVVLERDQVPGRQGNVVDVPNARARARGACAAVGADDQARNRVERAAAIDGGRQLDDRFFALADGADIDLGRGIEREVRRRP